MNSNYLIIIWAIENCERLKSQKQTNELKKMN